MLKEKMDNVEDNIENFSKINNIEPLLEVINPTESNKYKRLQKEIKNLKKDFSRDKIPFINEKTRELNSLIKNSIKDPQEVLDLVHLYANTNEEKIIFYFSQKEKLYDFLEEKLAEQLDCSYNVIKTLNLKTSPYFFKLFNTDDDFNEAFSQLLKYLEKNPDKTPLEVFNSLLQNIETRNIFEENGINYDKWVEYNPDSYIDIKIETNKEAQEQAALKNLESDFNDDLFKKLPHDVIKSLQNALLKEGYELKETMVPNFDADGYNQGEIERFKLYKNNKPVIFEDLPKIINIIRKEINENEWWNLKIPRNPEIYNARTVLKNHLYKLRYNEIKNAKRCKDIVSDIRVQKTDMNNIPHSLFLGNHAACCTQIGGGCNESTAPNYIMNKLISAIEIKAGEKFVGNTMCFLADVDGELSLVLDNIELNPQYQFNDKIRDAIFEYARKICKEIGKPNIPIYAGENRHKVNLDNFEINLKDMSILGSTGNDEIYLDFDTDFSQIDSNNYFHTKLYRIS